LSFSISFGPDEVQEWQEFFLANVRLSISMDKVDWLLDAKRVFSVRSLYRFILNPKKGAGARIRALVVEVSARVSPLPCNQLIHATLLIVT
jgi:hypothetical protein